jgi:hypothetical protein
MESPRFTIEHFIWRNNAHPHTSGSQVQQAHRGFMEKIQTIANCTAQNFTFNV